MSVSLSVWIAVCLSHSVALAEYSVYREIDPSTHAAAEAPTQPNQCYQFTWDGAYDEEDDLTRTCDDYFPTDVCFPPLVYTNGSNPMSGPDLGELNQKCSNMTGGCKCTVDASTVCVKYTKLAKNAARTPVYFSSFCGSGVNNNNFGSHAVTSGCHRQTDLIGYDIEVCFCKGNLCNGGQMVSLGMSRLVGILAIIWLGMKLLL
eukprot:TRINITY_DN15110_c0_g1_i1.p1 TRINITY_DN15110_c0_g1~~TRINITY_DN15110_c0_g1_i1.p1  ORF type:complete len:214 (+),score=60.73 TRINITY_DN15110_c0_g1_i1:32-643(+)